MQKITQTKVLKFITLCLALAVMYKNLTAPALGALFMPTDQQTVKTESSSYEDGELLRDKGVIYIVEYGLKRPFVSMKVFNGLGYKLSNVASADTGAIPLGEGIFSYKNRHPRGTNVLYKKTVYFLGKDFRYPYPSLPIFYSWGASLTKIVPANSADIGLPQGSAVNLKISSLDSPISTPTPEPTPSQSPVSIPTPSPVSVSPSASPSVSPSPAAESAQNLTLSASPSNLNFGSTMVDVPSSAIAVTLTNSSSSSISITSIQLPSGASFQNTPSLPANLAANQTLNFSLIYTATTVGSFNSAATISFTGGTLNINLTGTAAATGNSLSSSQFNSSYLNPPTHAPIVSLMASGGNIAPGNYKVKITYFNAAGETTASPASPAITVSSGSSQILIASSGLDDVTPGTLGFNIYISTDGVNYKFANTANTMASVGLVPAVTPPATTAASAISAGQNTVSPQSVASNINKTGNIIGMTNIYGDSLLGIDIGNSQSEIVAVTGGDYSSFKAVFTKAHAANFTIQTYSFIWTGAALGSAAPPSSNTAAISSIQNCLNILPASGGTCNVPAGTYNLSTSLVLSRDNLQLVCSSAQTTTLKMISNDNVIIGFKQGYPLAGSTLTNIKVANCGIDGNQASIAHNPTDTYETGINCNRCAFATITGNRVSNVFSQAITVYGSGDISENVHNSIDHNTITAFGEVGISLAVVSQSIVDNNTVSSSLNIAPFGGALGIMSSGNGTGNSITNNTVSNIDIEAINVSSDSSNALISNNQIDHARVGIRINNLTGGSAPDHLTISNNIIKDINDVNGWTGACIALLYDTTQKGDDVVSNNSCTNAPGNGITLSLGKNIQVTNNTITHAGYGTNGQDTAGVVFDVTADSSISGSTISGTTGPAIRVAANSKNIHITGNQLSGSISDQGTGTIVN